MNMLTAVATCLDRISAVHQLVQMQVASAHAEAGVLPLQAITEAVGVAIPQLSSVIGLFLILFIIFCLSGVALFSGSFHRRCVLPSGPDPSDYVYSYTPWFCGNLNTITHKSKVHFGAPHVAGRPRDQVPDRAATLYAYRCRTPALPLLYPGPLLPALLPAGFHMPCGIGAGLRQHAEPGRQQLGLRLPGLRQLRHGGPRRLSGEDGWHAGRSVGWVQCPASAGSNVSARDD